RTLLKFAVPASPRRRPVIEYRLNAARTSWTAGKTTTPTISSRAGPSHSRAAHTEVSRLVVRRRGVDSLDTTPPATAGGTDAPGGTVDAAAATGIRPGSAAPCTSGSAIDQLPFSAVFCRLSSTDLGSPLAPTPAPRFCCTASLTLSHVGSSVGVRWMLGRVSR